MSEKIKKRIMVKGREDIRIGVSRKFGYTEDGIHLFRCTAKQDRHVTGRYLIEDSKGMLIAIARGIEEVHVNFDLV